MNTPKLTPKTSAAVFAALEHTLAALDDAKKLHPYWIYTDAQNAARTAIQTAHEVAHEEELFEQYENGTITMEELFQDLRKTVEGWGILFKSFGR